MPSARRERIAVLDGVRAAAIAMVVCAHCAGTGFYSSLRVAHWLADLGVRSFFVLSGFLITNLLLRERCRTGTISLRGFYVRRIFRIFPALYVYIVVVSIVGRSSLQPHDSIYAATFVMNFHGQRGWLLGHMWSLSVEEQFYLIWPLVLLLLAPRAGVRIAIAALVIGPVARLAIWYGFPSYRAIADQAFPCVADALATGCLLAMLRERLESDALYARVHATRWFWPTTLLILSSALITTPWITLGPSTTITNIAVALAIHHLLLQPRSLVARGLQLPSVVRLGVLSYSLYLWQQVFLDRHSDAWYCAFPTNVVLAVVTAAASQYVIERPFNHLSRLVTRSRSRSFSRTAAESEETQPVVDPSRPRSDVSSLPERLGISLEANAELDIAS
jgi:peptidoglycan/LPS O-acetylase OafA/YrhL